MTRQLILSTRGSKKIINTMGTPACTFKQLWDNVRKSCYINLIWSRQKLLNFQLNEEYKTIVLIIPVRFVSMRKMTLLGALVFLGFAIASVFIDPNEDGIDGIPQIQVDHVHCKGLLQLLSGRCF